MIWRYYASDPSGKLVYHIDSKQVGLKHGCAGPQTVTIDHRLPRVVKYQPKDNPKSFPIDSDQKLHV